MHKTIGSLLLDSGKISIQEAEDIIQQQAQDGSRFGDAAIKLGYVSENDIKFAVSQQFDYSFLPSDDSSIDQCLISAFLISGPEIEAFKSLRSQLTLRWLTENKSVLVSSVEGGVGTSYVSSNLAVMFAQLGKKTLLIDANMRHPTQHLCFRHDNNLGLSQVLANRAELSEAVYDVKGINNLSVLFAGVIPPNPIELLGRSSFKELHHQLEHEYDIIIVDSPPVLKYSETELLSSILQGVVLVAKKDETSIKGLKEAKTRLEAAGAMPLGVTINDFSRKRANKKRR